MKNFLVLASQHGVAPENIIAFATSAIREAKNRCDFLRRIREETGLKVKIISGKEEAEFIYYGVRNAVNIGKTADLLFDIDGQGSKQLKKNYPRAITIFVIPPSLEALEKRLQKRETDSSAVIGERVAKACAEIAQARDYAYIIINDIYAQALQALHSIVLAEKHRGERMKKHLTIFGKF